MDFPPLDFSRIRTYALRERPNKVAAEAFAHVHKAGSTFAAFFDNLPHILAGQDLRNIVQDIVNATRNGRPVLLMMGAHPIKCGLNPLITEMMRRGIISAVAFNGAGAIHDFETAYQGETSEDVQKGLDDGTFGMVDETSRFMNTALERGVILGLGAGEILGQTIRDSGFPKREDSILCTGVEMNAPVTVHIALGTDIIHQHPTANGAVLGETSYRDFQRFSAVVAQLQGGVVLNVGSAVIMPEVFLKALTIARNLGNEVTHFTTATFDMIRQYRPTENVMRRPTHLGGKGYYLTGHHEIMIPLLFAAVTEKLVQQ